MAAVLLLLVAYAALALANDPGGYLGTDTGGKVLTLQAMEDRGGGTDLDVGYWAEDLDPDGTLHPYFGTTQLGDRWIQVTTVPMILAAAPLWEAGGYRLALALPMVGGVLCALAARALAVRFDADRVRAWWAFWAVGLAGPVLLYAVDLWEHTLGLAAMAWAMVALAGARVTPEPRRAATLGLVAGLLWGAGYSMRTESLLYGATVTAAVLVAVVRADRRVARASAIGAASAVGVGVAVLANRALESWVLGGSLRTGRTGSAASAAGAGVGERLREGLVTTVGLASGAGAPELLLGGAGVAALGLLAWVATLPAGHRLRARLPLLAVVGALPYLVAVSRGLDFVPGLFLASPLAVVGLVLGRRPASAPFWWAAVASLPAVWLFQYVGGAGPQWGARYALLSAFVLVVAGIAALPRLGPVGQRTFAGLAIGITLFGAAWMVVRTHGAADAGRTLGGRPEPVLIAAGETGFLPREFVAGAGSTRWLSASDRDELDAAVALVEEAGFDRFAVLELAGHRSAEDLGAYELAEVAPVAFLPGADLQVASYRTR